MFTRSDHSWVWHAKCDLPCPQRSVSHPSGNNLILRDMQTICLALVQRFTDFIFPNLVNDVHVRKIKVKLSRYTIQVQRGRGSIAHAHS
jgi:hypothetical protein